MAFLYTNKKLSEKETKKSISLSIATVTTTTKNNVRGNKFNQGGIRPVFEILCDPETEI